MEINKRTHDELQQALPHIQSAPRDTGVLQMIVRRPAVDAREVLDEAHLDPVAGLVGDTWPQRPSSRTPDKSPHPEMQLTLMNSRVIGAIAGTEATWPLAGDQLFVDLDLSAANVPPGTRLAIGDAIVEVSTQPHTGCEKFVRRFGLDAMKWVNSPAGREMNLRGINARVVRGGRIARGNVIRKVGS